MEATTTPVPVAMKIVEPSALGIISEGLGLAREIFTYINTKESNKWIDKITELDLSIKEELEKAYDQQNDVFIVSLYQEYGIIRQAASAQLRLAEVKKTP